MNEESNNVFYLYGFTPAGRLAGRGRRGEERRRRFSGPAQGRD